MKKIKLNPSGFALVDNEDFEYLNHWRWQLLPNGYVGRTIGNRKEKRKMLYMHRVVNDTPEGYVTDHINRKRQDNRWTNLRTVTPGVNSLNCSFHKDNQSGVRGINWDKGRKKWLVRLTIEGKSRNLGRFNNLEDAKKHFQDIWEEYYKWV